MIFLVSQPATTKLNVKLHGNGKLFGVICCASSLTWAQLDLKQASVHERTNEADRKRARNQYWFSFLPSFVCWLAVKHSVECTGDWSDTHKLCSIHTAHTKDIHEIHICYLSLSLALSFLHTYAVSVVHRYYIRRVWIWLDLLAKCARLKYVQLQIWRK